MCYWNRLIDSSSSVFSNGGHDPDPSNPLVYHLHGCLDDKHSIVITEDDYLDFLVKLGKDDQLLPPRIQRAVCGSSLLFLGYALSDWTFRVLFRGLVHGMEGSGRSVSVTVQLAPGDQEYKEYLSEYFGKNNMRVYWGTARQFATELNTEVDRIRRRARWRLARGPIAILMSGRCRSSARTRADFSEETKRSRICFR